MKQPERVEVRFILALTLTSLLWLTPDIAAAVESFINVCKLFEPLDPYQSPMLITFQANPKLATQKDDDDRLPIHWAVSYNHLPIVELLVSRKDFDPDVQVSFLS